MTTASKYILRVTAGPTYTDQTEVTVNTETPHRISNAHIEADVTLRIQNFRGVPASPSTSPYFSHSSRSSALYSLEFAFTLPESVSSDDLVFGNDFDHPIRDKLPPLFGQAFGYVKRWIDPGLDGDPYADEPYLYGRVVGSVNAFSVGAKGKLPSAGGKGAAEKPEDERDDDEEVRVIEEGAEGEDAEAIRKEIGIPATGAARQKFFLDQAKRKAFEFEAGRVYKCDFFNGYLDFNDFSLKLPLGLSLNIVRHWDGQPLRYVLRNQKTGDLLFAICFTLVPTDEESKAAMEKQTGRKVPDIVKPGGEGAKVEGAGKKEGFEDEGVD